MSDAVACETEAPLEYLDFIRQAFIDPIRSVSVVDDEYPTLDNMLARQKKYTEMEYRYSTADESQIKKEVIDNLIPIVELCRSLDHNWMLDVYDGKPLEEIAGQLRFAQRLTHSDLLILDYHLEGEHDGPGKLALGILRQLANVDHFNLVVVHTKGYQSSPGNVAPVLRDIVAALQKKPEFKQISERKAKEVEEKIDDEWKDVDQSIREKLQESLTDLDLLYLVRDYGIKDKERKSFLESEYANSFRAIYKNKPTDIDLNEHLLFWWVLSKRFEKICPQFSSDGAERVDWGRNGSINWVRTDKLFVTIIGKEVNADKLPECLVTALADWNPHPHKLLMAKLRHEVDEKGISIATDILENHYVQAHWLEKLISVEPNALPTEIWDIIEKHWEELASRTRDSLSDFANQMITCLKNGCNVQEIKDKFINPGVSSDLRNISAYANCFNCSKAITGHHLTTGHVLKILEGTTAQYWLCLSPACDLVPGQKEVKLGNYLPVKLVQLYDVRTAFADDSGKVPDVEDAFKQALSVANSNEMLFLKIDKTIVALSFTSRFGKANPKWEQFYAENNGIFKSDKEIPLKRIMADKANALVFEPREAEVVAQLRYEYAINLLQKLGSSMTRVGLDFVQLPSISVPGESDAGKAE